MFFKKPQRKKINGYIAYYGLTDWWLNEFSEKERQTIKGIYHPLGADPRENLLEKGNRSSSQSKLQFLSCLASWFTKCEHYEIGKKILAEGEKCVASTGRILDLHFFYSDGFKVHYPNRDKDDNALSIAIDYCKRSIALAPQAKIAFRTDPAHMYSVGLPRHPGYEHLAIIYEKQGRLEEALELTRQAQEEGWNNDCQKRIDRLLKKINKKTT